jgi:tripartite-type tricarboxylate transporter receptor subunit TctC
MACLFAKNYALKVVHVAYIGTPEAVIDAIAGRVTYIFAPRPSAFL